MSPTRPRYIIDVDAGASSPVSRRAAREVVETVLRLEKVRHAMVSVAFVTNRRIATLNARHLGHRGPTDVISFAFDRPDDEGPVVGDVYVAPAVARANARMRTIPIREEVVRLLIHGTLHVLGYVHPEGAGRERSPMWTRQEQLVRRLARRRSA